MQALGWEVPRIDVRSPTEVTFPDTVPLLCVC